MASNATCYIVENEVLENFGHLNFRKLVGIRKYLYTKLQTRNFVDTEISRFTLIICTCAHIEPDRYGTAVLYPALNQQNLNVYT